MFRIAPYYPNTVKRRTTGSRDIFDLFEDFFTENASSNFRVDVRDTGTEYILYADLPGINKEDIDIHFEDEKLVVSVNKEENNEEVKEDYIHRERFTRSLERSFFLKDVDPTKFKATLENGVLTINAPKYEDKIKSYKIEIE